MNTIIFPGSAIREEGSDPIVLVRIVQFVLNKLRVVVGLLLTEMSSWGQGGACWIEQFRPITRIYNPPPLPFCSCCPTYTPHFYNRLDSVSFSAGEKKGMNNPKCYDDGYETCMIKHNVRWRLW